MSDNKLKNNVIEYIKWRGDLTFEQDPFNEVDNLVLCIIAYLNFSRFPESRELNIKSAKNISFFSKQMTNNDDQLGLSELSYLPVINKASESLRFKDVKIFAYDSIYDNKESIQFQAVSFALPDNSIYCAYMGTDRSFAGWKEDFNLSYKKTVPSQHIALEYAVAIYEISDHRKLRIGGHSKGGNLATFTVINLPAKIQDDVLAAYNNDGPGFIESYIDTEKYLRIKNKLFTFIPESSIVGVLLNHSEDYCIIASANDSIMQHESMSWQIEGNHFVRLGERSEMGKMADEVLRKWIYGLSEVERKQFVDILFDILSADGNLKTIDDVKALGITGKIDIIKRYENESLENKELLNKVFQSLQLDIRKELLKTTEIDIVRLLKQRQKLLTNNDKKIKVKTKTVATRKKKGIQ